MEDKMRFVIEPAEAEAMAKESGVATVTELLPLLVPAAQQLARPPISRFPVGSVALGSSGRIYVGVNLEFLGLPLNHSVHSEQFLMINAALHGEAAIHYIAVSHVPCGHCRQFLQETRGAAEIQILVTSDGDAAAFRPLSSLLPQPFGPHDLLDRDVPLLLELHNNEIGPLLEAPAAVEDGVTANGRAAIVCNGFMGGGLEEKLKAAAERAARAAHAPYSGCAAGFAVANSEGRVFAGPYVESAAFNPSLGPMQAAMVAYLVAGIGQGWDVYAAALVEKEAAAVSHEATARIFLAAVSPQASLKVYRFRSCSSLSDVAA